MRRICHSIYIISCQPTIIITSNITLSTIVAQEDSFLNQKNIKILLEYIIHSFWAILTSFQKYNFF